MAKKKLKSYGVFGVILLMALGIYLWSYPLNNGKALVTAGVADYWVFFGNSSASCPADPCQITLPTGTIALKIQKDGYFPQPETLSVRRFQTQTVAVTLKKIPTLTGSESAPAEPPDFGAKPLPSDLGSAKIMAFAWDSKGEKMAYLDKADEKVKIWSNGTIKIITPLKSIKEGLRFLWSSNGTLLVGLGGEDLYFIDTQKASRKKIIVGFVPQSTLWNEGGDGLLIAETKDKIYKLDPQGGKPVAIALRANLNDAVWGSDGKLIYFLVDEKEYLTRVFAYDPATNESTEIVSKYNFPVSKITRDVTGSIYFFNSDLKSWSVLEQ